MKLQAWIVPAFFLVVVAQALLVILDRAGVLLPIPAKLLSVARLTLAVMTLATLATWSVHEWQSRRPAKSKSSR